MSKKTNVPFESNVSLNLGEINITTGVLESIAAKAASEVEGVYKLHASVQNEIGGFVTRSRDRIGVKVRREENAIVIDTEIRLQYGFSVPEVAIKVQERVKEQILFMTDLAVQEVNVHVLSVETEPAEYMSDEQVEEFGEDFE